MSAITPERIQAEVEAEVRRIEVWNDGVNRQWGEPPEMSPQMIRSLAEHLVRNRLQVERAQ